MSCLRYVITIALLFGLASSKVVTPEEGGKKTSIIVKDKSYDYWLINRNGEAKFTVSGIATARIYVRTEVGKKPNITIKLDNTKLKSITIDEKQSNIAHTKVFNKVTKAWTINLKIPRGKHILSLESDDEIIVRLTSKKKVSYIAMAPQRHDGGMVLVAGEEEFGYYRCSQDKAVEYVLIGPGTTTLYTRLLFSPGMMGTQHYKLRIQVDNNEPTIYEFESKASAVSYFRNNGQIIPGKAKKIKIKIPKGKHTISVKPTGSIPVAVRLMLPMSMIKKK